MKVLYQLAKAFERKIEGIFEGKGSFPYGNCIVSYNIGGRSAAVEVYNPLTDKYLVNIAEFLESLVQIPDMEYDEWDDHGFRDEEDYWRWKL